MFLDDSYIVTASSRYNGNMPMLALTMAPTETAMSNARTSIARIRSPYRILPDLDRLDLVQYVIAKDDLATAAPLAVRRAAK
ncbi:MAG TPA: hypothetical protein VMU99_07200 [Acidimicrobiales bacterium]|nr:hypothetical protein [Acidimicrobiales bacterium]